MKATGRFCVKLAGIGSATFLYLFLASPSPTSNLLYAQSVTFAGAKTTISSTLDTLIQIAVDSGENLFFVDGNVVVELPRTRNGYGLQRSLPISGLSHPQGVAVDSAGDVFIGDYPNARVVVLPKTPTGYGAQTTLPFSGLDYPIGVAVDGAGDVFIADYSNRVLELPKTPTGYGAQTTLPFSGLDYPIGVAVDGAGDVFIADLNNNRVVELPKTPTGYGAQTTLPTSNLASPYGVAVDSSENVFITDPFNYRVVELSETPTGYSAQTTLLPFSGFPESSTGVAVDGAGNVFVVEDERSVFEWQTHSVDFGGANICATGATTPAPCSEMLTLNYRVNADANLGIPEVHTGGTPNLDFKRASGSTCIGAVTGGSTCTVNVTLAPLAAGIRNGSVQITDNGIVIAATQISGFGVDPTGPPVAQVSMPYLPFGTIAFGSSQTLPLLVSNTGGGTLTVTPSISTYSGGPSRSYTIAGSTCGGGLTWGNSCTLQVKYSPQSIATHYAQLTLQTNGESNPVVKLHGASNGLSVLGGGGGSLTFGSVSSGSTEVSPLTITNVGLPGTVTVATAITVRATTRLTATYRILTTAQNTCLAGIAAGESCTLPVEFAPTASGVHDDLLTLTPSTGGGATTVWLIGSTP